MMNYPNGGMNPQQGNSNVQGNQPVQQQYYANPYQPVQQNMNPNAARPVYPQSGTMYGQQQGFAGQNQPYQQNMQNANGQPYPQGTPVAAKPQAYQAGYPQQQPVRQPNMQQPYGGQNTQRPVYPPQGMMQNGQVPPQSPFVDARNNLGYSRNQNPYQNPYPNPYQNPYPQQQPAPQMKKPFNWSIPAKIFVFGVVPLFFLTAMVLSQITLLKWLYLAIALVAILMMWIRPLVTPSTRLTLTAVYVLAMIVAVVSALMMPGNDSKQTASPASRSGGVVPPVSQSVSYNGNYGDSSMNTIAMLENVGEQTISSLPEAKDPLDTDAVRQLETFFYYWSVNATDNMLSLCAPSWQGTQSNPSTALFQITANRTPTDYKVEKISGTENDFTRTVTLTATIDKNNHMSVAKYRMQIVMLLENGTWFVDPRSLSTQEVAETPDPNVTPAPTATATPSIASSTKLYYNADGGAKYHLDPNCKSINKKYTPLKNSFTYGEVNHDKYKKLDACNICGAPLRQ